jgi:sulfur carrier protein
MKIVLNGADTEVEGATIAALWEAEQASRELDSSKGYAIALNGALVRKADWPTTAIKAHDRIEIVRAISGG